MLVKSALTAALAATAHSFVIVPDLTPADNAFGNAAPLDPSENIRAVSINCPGCPVSIPAFGGAKAAIATDAPNHLEMTFSIDSSPAGDRLLVNGFELYPNPDPFTSPLSAPQVLEISDMAMRGAKKSNANDQKLGYRLQVYPLAKDGEESQFIEVIGVDLQVIEVGDAFVDGIPLVKVLLGKKGDDLAIMEANTFESTASVDPAAECTTWLCRFRAAVAKKLSTFKKPCPGKIAHGFHGMPHHGMPHHGEDHGEHPHVHFSHPAHAPGVLRTLMMIVTHVVFPIMLGVIVGVSAGLLTMTLISASLSMYAAVCGQTSQPPSRKADATEAAVEEGEKDGLMEGQEHADPPPSYGEESAAPRS